MKVLVLGGTGAIGSHVCSILGALGHAVVVTSRSSRPREENVEYAKGNAHEDVFLARLLESRWDCVIDFLNYRTPAFVERVNMLLSGTQQYVFLSSARVYADCSAPITEQSPRLLEETTDQNFLEADEYGVAKARQEDLLLHGDRRNWTIVRPYISYDAYRLQLGILEKEEWLARVMRGVPIIFPRQLLGRRTTMTWGRDVASCLVGLVGLTAACGQAFNITTAESHTWSEVLEQYEQLIWQRTGQRARVHLCELHDFEGAFPRHYQIHYDRLFDRVFDNGKIAQIVDVTRFKSLADGLTVAMQAFFQQPRFGYIDWGAEGRADRVAGSWALPRGAPTARAALKYLRYRWIPCPRGAA